ncbi:hypothetical protein PghCCS26_47330 [Paenibacillus glycanilyticus]|uniref:Uncharacterized protein n=1 Tax=Paenibacillus glycanilyticus TaxID=126569 RepID=A0ABQ6NSR9_9BACL|nr:hypothetical protein [Paenibacillus glycanilyticus]GMK47603.1 hypothetical protein PghCCS26_47330 [Paenibacillus glycanilyticus]
MTKINRNISVGINVETPAELPKLGEQLAKFLRKVDVEHGPFDVTIGLQVGGFENAPRPADTVVNNYYGDGTVIDEEDSV